MELTKEEFNARVAVMRKDYESTKTEEILHEVKSRMQGCPMVHCISCARNDVMIDELRMRLASG